MQTYISMLRGINVSGSKKIKMTELKALYEKLKFKEVKTYIQSGNVIFQSNLSEEKIISKIFKGIKKEWGYEVTIILHTPKTLKKIIDNNPFVKKRKENTSKLYFTFLENSPDKESVNNLSGFVSNNDEFIISKNVIYTFYPDGFSKSKLHNNFFERKLNVGATTRNWNSTNKLAALAAEI